MKTLTLLLIAAIFAGLLTFPFSRKPKRPQKVCKYCSNCGNKIEIVLQEDKRNG